MVWIRQNHNNQNSQSVSPSDTNLPVSEVLWKVSIMWFLIRNELSKCILMPLFFFSMFDCLPSIVSANSPNSNLLNLLCMDHIHRVRVDQSQLCVVQFHNQLPALQFPSSFVFLRNTYISPFADIIHYIIPPSRQIHNRSVICPFFLSPHSFFQPIDGPRASFSCQFLLGYFRPSEWANGETNWLQNTLFVWEEWREMANRYTSKWWSVTIAEVAEETRLIR